MRASFGRLRLFFRKIRKKARHYSPSAPGEHRRPLRCSHTSLRRATTTPPRVSLIVRPRLPLPERAPNLWRTDHMDAPPLTHDMSRELLAVVVRAGIAPQRTGGCSCLMRGEIGGLHVYRSSCHSLTARSRLLSTIVAGSLSLQAVGFACRCGEQLCHPFCYSHQRQFVRTSTASTRPPRGLRGLKEVLQSTRSTRGGAWPMR